jgi:hypothetical protein
MMPFDQNPNQQANHIFMKDNNFNFRNAVIYLKGLNIF